MTRTTSRIRHSCTYIYRYVCPTEIIAFSDAAKRFEEVGAKVRV